MVQTGMHPNPSLKKPVIPIILFHMRNMWINPGMLQNTGKTTKYSQKTETEERANGQREQNGNKRKIGKGGFVRGGFG